MEGGNGRPGTIFDPQLDVERTDEPVGEVYRYDVADDGDSGLGRNRGRGVDEQLRVVVVVRCVVDEEVVAEVVSRMTGVPLTRLEKEEVKSVLAKTIYVLPEKEKQVISLYYYDDMTFKEIGNILNVSESRVCQLHGKAILALQVSVCSLKGERLVQKV